MNNTYKDDTKQTYDQYPEIFEEFAEQFKPIVLNYGRMFLKHLRGKTILDVGAGTGVYAKWFADQGYGVTCIDISSAMVELCQQKGLSATVMDMESLDFEDNSFDGIWAYASLLHMKKQALPRVINELRRVVKPGGTIALALQRGNGEGYVADERYPGTKRWFSFYTDEDVRDLFDSWCDIVEAKTKHNHGWLNYVMVVSE